MSELTLLFCGIPYKSVMMDYEESGCTTVNGREQLHNTYRDILGEWFKDTVVEFVMPGELKYFVTHQSKMNEPEFETQPFD